MVIDDPIYGKFRVDGVLEELVLSKPVQRLKGVHQGGASYLVNEKWNVTRFEHSIGVMLLIRMLGGSLEEQIAGLLHDVSHTAFSHVVDFVFDHTNEDYHEKIFQKVITTTEIPIILQGYGYHYQDILLDESQWTILEQKAPELCADRVDYTLRDMYHYGQVSLHEVQEFLEDLHVRNGRMYLSSKKSAEWFVGTYYKEVIDFFMDPLNIYGYDMLAKVLKRSINKKIISLEDFLDEDEAVIKKIQSSGDKEINQLLEKIHYDVVVEEEDENYDLHRKTKVRLIDPSILEGNEFIPASHFSGLIREMGEKAYKKAVMGVFVKVISN
ncbi:hypothetical protein SAMN05216389_106240 [Oceanobacillus limi]|uniref:HD domain-containing protein n=1 Tax=Oceanobacillus limi TaxID=930131 RepID=A0A1I0CHH0_9BACI|nr:HD domain-containing protein [Oceanobacillus limi]SET19034.1 hypothetical protein SAMN05216389_106240 [Oceanobacillus limi]